MSKSVKPTRAPHSDGGFTLLEVMIALLLGMIGLLGTVAMQQTVLRAAQNANDAAIAMRLATQRLEQFNVATIDMNATPQVDELAPRAAATGALGIWSTPEFLDNNGRCLPDTTTWSAACRWRREWQVTNTGANLPYNVSVRVTYNLDGAVPKTIRVDMERRKTF